MKFRLIATLAVGLLITGVVAAAAANPSSGKSGPPQLVSAFGKAHVGGQVAAVHVVAVVPDGSNANEVGAAAIAAQGARPITSAEYSLITVKHPDTSSPADQISDAQFNYVPNSPKPDGVTALDAEAAVARALGSWITVAGGIDQLDVNAMGVASAACPSLVRECDGPQIEDGSNDIGWADIKGRTTLGVTWSTATEADIALDIHQSWIINSGSGIDVESVAVHEIGHGLGLGHSEADASQTVMNAYYSTVNQTPGSDDVAGLKCKYDGVCEATEPPPTPTPTGTPVVEAQSDARTGGRSADRDLVFTVDTSAPGGTVSVRLEYLSGGQGPWTGTSTADDQGIVSFRLRNAPKGDFVNTVTSIVAPWGECGTSGAPSCENGAINPYFFTSVS